MSRHTILFLTFVLLMAVAVQAQLQNDTTLSAETAVNGTHAGMDTSQLFQWPNGNDFGHISRENVHNLVPGFPGQILARYMPWWGSSGRCNARVLRCDADIHCLRPSAGRFAWGPPL